MLLPDSAGSCLQAKTTKERISMATILASLNGGTLEESVLNLTNLQEISTGNTQEEL